jgi:hypothetical protein
MPGFEGADANTFPGFVLPHDYYVQTNALCSGVYSVEQLSKNIDDNIILVSRCWEIVMQPQVEYAHLVGLITYSDSLRIASFYEKGRDFIFSPQQTDPQLVFKEILHSQQCLEGNMFGAAIRSLDEVVEQRKHALVENYGFAIVDKGLSKMQYNRALYPVAFR